MRIRSSVVALFIVVQCISLSSAAAVTFFLDATAPEDSVHVATEIVRADSVVYQVIASEAMSCKYSAFPDLPYAAMERTFDFSFESIHKDTLIELEDGVYRYYVRCQNASGFVTEQLETVFSVNVPVHAIVALDESPPLSNGRYQVTVQTSKVVSSAPQLGYSFDGVSYNTIPLFGSGTIWSGYLIISENAGEQVGSFRFSARDLEGFEGTQITNGGLFIVDTKKPPTMIDVQAEGYAGRVQLNWFYDSDSAEYRIYRSRSPGVSRSDLLTTITDETMDSYADTSVTAGATYYYRIGVVDEAGNEGDLSPEIFSTALLANTTVVSSGLEPRFLGFVDSLLADIDGVAREIEDARFRFESLNGEEQFVFETMRIDRELDTAQSELEALTRETETVKTQSLSQTELDRKLNTYRLRLTSLKRKVPESLRIVDSESREIISGENAVTQAMLALYPSATQEQVQKGVAETLATLANAREGVVASAYAITISYLDGTQSERTLIEKQIGSLLESPQNYSIAERIPRSVATLDDVEILTSQYSLNEEASIIVFEASETSVVYSFDEHIDFASLDDLQTVLVYDPLLIPFDTSSFGITGFFSFVDEGSGTSYFGVILGLLITAGLGVYWYSLRRDRFLAEELIDLRERIATIDDLVSQQDYPQARKLYAEIGKDYEHLSSRAKKMIYIDLKQIHEQLGDGTNV